MTSARIRKQPAPPADIAAVLAEEHAQPAPPSAPGPMDRRALIAAIEDRLTDCCAWVDDDGVFCRPDERCGRCSLDLDVRDALRAEQDAAHKYTPDPQWPGSGCTVCGRQRLPSHAWTAPTDAARKEGRDE
jgi:hypothetical protein